ncbi:MAG: SMI1/KNR4 family protein [bacterium]|nr:SMI1/KNR4 family protein [bacterium]
MLIEHLTKIFPPPKLPLETGSDQDWAPTEQAIGANLPDDFKAFTNLYGTGYINEFLWIRNPFAKLPALNLLERCREQLDALRILKADCGDAEVPYPVYPDPGGLFPWAGTDNGDVLYWSTLGNPSQWTIVINEARGPIWEEYDCSMVAFLLRLLTGQVSSEVLPDGFPRPGATFKVYRP